MEIFVNNKLHHIVCSHLSGSELKQYIDIELGLNSEQYYLLTEGKRIEDDHVLKSGTIHVIPKVVGGKGGFGSMLRAIGAQIEKTTNREACRDLSGRRLRDINEEQRLKNWINQQAEREKEAKERKKKKLERLCEKPKHEFKDEDYDKERSELPEIVEDAVLQGLQASCSSKRKIVDNKEVVKKKKPKLWVDDELDDDLTSSEEENEDTSSEETRCRESGMENSENSVGTSTLNDTVGRPEFNNEKDLAGNGEESNKEKDDNNRINPAKECKKEQREDNRD